VSRTDIVENYVNRELLLRYLGVMGFRDLEDIQDEQPVDLAKKFDLIVFHHFFKPF